MDLSDIGGNVMHGAHIASIGGTWMALVYGFGGLRDHGGRITFNPRLPAEWRALRFPLTVRGSLIRVEVRHDRTSYRLETGDALTVFHADEALVLLPTHQLPPAPRPRHHRSRYPNFRWRPR